MVKLQRIFGSTLEISFRSLQTYIMDRAYVDFERLYDMHQAQAYFVIREKPSISYQ